MSGPAAPLANGLKRRAYEVADRLAPRGLPRVVNGECMRLSLRAARFYRGLDDPEKAAFLRLYCRPGSTTLDIGANFGVFTVIMARAVGEEGRVLALEPTPSTCRALRRTVAQNGAQHVVEVRQAAAALTSGIGTLHVSKHVGDMGNSLVDHASASAAELLVTLVTVDEISAGADVSCLKIDAEGAELDILQGSRLTLARCRPALTVEVHPWLLDRSRRLAIWDLLARCQYEVRLGGRRLDREAFLLHERPFEVQAFPEAVPEPPPRPSTGKWPPSGLEDCPACPACATTKRSPWFVDLPDRLYGNAPGLWTFQRCADCGAGYLDPRPTRETIGQAYGEYYTHSAPTPAGSRAQPEGAMARWRRGLRHGYLNRRLGLSLPGASFLGPLLVPLAPRLAARQRRWARLARPHDRASLLDVGSGSGAAVAHFQALGWDAVGLDVDPSAIAVARAAGLPVTEGEITSLPGGARFDAITMSHSIEHLHDPGSALRAVYRLLKPSGVLQLITPNAGSLGLRVYARDWLGLDPPRHLVVFTPRAIALALHQAGFPAVRFHHPYRASAWYFEASEALRRGRPWTERGRPRGLAKWMLVFSERSAGVLPRLGEELVVTATKPASARP